MFYKHIHIWVEAQLCLTSDCYLSNFFPPSPLKPINYISRWKLSCHIVFLIPASNKMYIENFILTICARLILLAVEVSFFVSYAVTIYEVLFMCNIDQGPLHRWINFLYINPSSGFQSFASFKHTISIIWASIWNCW